MFSSVGPSCQTTIDLMSELCLVVVVWCSFALFVPVFKKFSACKCNRYDMHLS